MSHDLQFVNEVDRKKVLSPLVQEFIEGKVVGNIVDGVAFRYSDVLIITTVDLKEKEEVENNLDEGVC